MWHAKNKRVAKITCDAIFCLLYQTINEMSGKHTGCLMWPGSDFAYRNVSCTYTYKYNTTESWTDRMDMALSWFQNKTNPTNLVMAYIEEPDQHGHIFSPDSDVVKFQLFIKFVFFFLNNRVVQQSLIFGKYE